jgi:hypothetical protein
VTLGAIPAAAHVSERRGRVTAKVLADHAILTRLPQCGPTPAQLVCSALQCSDARSRAGSLDGESTVIKWTPFTPRLRRAAAGAVALALGLLCTGILLGAEDAFRVALAVSLLAAFALALRHNFRQAQAASRHKRCVST